MGKAHVVQMADFEAAMERAREMKEKLPRAISAHYDRASGRAVVELSSKVAVSFRPEDAQGLEHAKAADLAEIEFSASGFGIHFPRLDADLYVPALLEGFLGSRKWIAARTAEAGGKSRSKAKKAAARANGAKGGRPRGKEVSAGDKRLGLGIRHSDWRRQQFGSPRPLRVACAAMESRGATH
jgi:hypothetical protein